VIHRLIFPILEINPEVVRSNSICAEIFPLINYSYNYHCAIILTKNHRKIWR